MSRRTDMRSRSNVRRTVWTLLLAALVFGCSTSGSKRPLPTTSRDPHGFTISESERVGARARSDFQRANRAIEEGEFERAIELLISVTEATPELSAAQINLGIAYQRVDELEKAKAALDKAIEAYPRHPVAHNELGIVLRRMGRFEEARKQYEAALEIYPDFHFARKNLAILCDLFISDLACALEHYELYTAAVPEDESAEMWIADLRSRTGQ